MLKSPAKLKILLALATGVAALFVSVPTSENLSFTSPAMANEGGDGNGVEELMKRMGARHTSRRGRSGSGTRNVFGSRRTSWEVFPGYRSRPSSAQRRQARLRNARRRAERRARIARAEERAALRRGPRAARRHAEAVARRAAREARRLRRARERDARRQATADRMRARRIANAAARNFRRMVGMDFNNDFMSTTDGEGNTVTVRTDRFGDRHTTVTDPNAIPAPAPAPARAPNPNAPWASAYNPATGITTMSIRLPNGNHQVTLTNNQGIPINRFLVQR